MKHKSIVRMTVWILAVAGFSGSALAEAPAGHDQRAVSQAIDQFYAALNTLFVGDPAPMKAVWSHADDVTYMGPDGSFEKGWEQVLDNWERQAALQLGGKVEPVNIHTVIGARIAYSSNVEVGENTNAGGQAEKVAIRATNIFRRENGEWKMVAHHTDLLPYLHE